jgi:hypothetical protein
MRYTLEAGRLTLTDAAGKLKQYHVLINGALFALDEANNWRFFFRRIP